MMRGYIGYGSGGAFCGAVQSVRGCGGCAGSALAIAVIGYVLAALFGIG